VSVTLGMLTAFGPFVTDFYLAVMPEMMEYFRTSASQVAASLTAGMIGLAAGQLFIGPLSDKYGRKRLLVGSMLLFAIASLGCIFTHSIVVFNMMRVVQGFAGAGGIVISKSMATDLYSGKRLTDFMALLQAINGVAPVVAPIIGGSLTNFTSWQGVFVCLLALGVVLMVCSCRLKESLPRERRSRQNLYHTYGRLFHVLRNRRFLLSNLANMFSGFMFFAYIAASPFVMQSVYGLSPFEFSLCFGLCAFMIGVGAALATRFHHANTALKWASIDMAVAAGLTAVCQWCRLPLAVLMPCYVYMLVCFGLLQPVATAIALDAERDNAGAASAVFGASLFVAGTFSSPLVGLGDLLVSSGLLYVAGAVACMAVTLPLCSTIKREALEKGPEGGA